MPFPVTNPALARALAAQGYAEPTPVQSAVLESQPAEADLLVSAQTGSGKTVAFGLAMGTTLLGEREKLPPAAAPLALCIAPTRELAMQVARELTWLYADAGARIATCVGGTDARREQNILMGGVHIVVGTPGRLVDHLERGNLDPSSLRVVVLDEADEMLDLGFREDLEEILDAAPAERRTLMFSATIARDIATLARKYQRDAVRIDTVNRNEPHGDIEYRAIKVAPNEIERATVNILRAYEAPGALVFCSTREAVRRLYAALRERGFGVVQLSGELTQKERTDALQALRDGHARVCVATDVAARGLDLPDLGLVIHADLPVNKAGLLHRSGRTGRAGKKGVSVVLVPYTRRRKAEQLFGSAGIEAVWANAPTAEEIRSKDQARMLEDPTLFEESTEEDLALGRKLIENRGAEQIAAALIRVWRQRLPEPEELFADNRPEPERQRFEAERAPRPDRLQPDQVTWFRVSVGRAKNADPKWLIPLICRLGHVTKNEIGSIRIFDRETKFEIANSHAERFAEAVKNASEADVRFEPSTAPSERPSGPRPPRDPDAPREYKKRDFGPREDKPAFERPAWKDKPRAEGAERPAWKPRAEASGERPAWKDKPRAEGSAERPAWKDKPRAEASAERPAWKDKPRAEGSAERPAWKDKPARADKPAWKDKPAAAAGGAYDPLAERPKPAFKPEGFKKKSFPAKPKPEGGKFKKKDNAGGPKAKKPW